MVKPIKCLVNVTVMIILIYMHLNSKKTHKNKSEKNKPILTNMTFKNDIKTPIKEQKPIMKISASFIT